MSRGRGLLLVYYGDGKGKTTAAIGLAIRAIGHGFKVILIQFIKRDLNVGEYAILKNMKNIVHIVTGPGLGSSRDEIIKHADIGLTYLENANLDDVFLVILDEVGVLVERYGYPIEKILNIIEKILNRGVNVLLTGRYMPMKFIEIADLVTEFRCVKHYYENIRRSVVGLEY